MSLIKRMSPDEKKRKWSNCTLLNAFDSRSFYIEKYNDSSVHSNLYYFSLSNFKRSDRKYISW